MLRHLAAELQALMNQMMSDSTLCFLCRSAAVGAFITNIHINELSLEHLPSQSHQLPWKTVYKTIRSFEYPSWAACKAGAKAHVELKEEVSRCLDKCENKRELFPWIGK